MAQKDRPEPSLELPSLGLGRKRRKAQGVESPTPEPTQEPTQEPTPEPTQQPTPEPSPAPVATDTRPSDTEPGPGPDEDLTSAPDRSRPRIPQLAPVPAGLVTGLVVGLATVGLVLASQAGCELLRGTSTCGNAGILVVVAILVLAGLLGGRLLAAFGIADGSSTSFLAMGLVAVVLMLVLGDQLFAWWMVIAVPLVAMVAFVLAQRVTTAMVAPGGREMHR